MIKNKLMLLIIPMLLMGCEDCERVYNKKLQTEVFMQCMDKAGEARKGRDYTTNDDEDYDEVISMCNSIARDQTSDWVCTNRALFHPL